MTGHITIADCRHIVGTFYRIRKETMLSEKRKWRIAHPRQIAMTLSREFTGASLPRIGAQFGGRDHTTVLHAMRAVREREAASEKTRGDMENFRLTLLTYKFQREAETI